jgi:hypothetical protein
MSKACEANGLRAHAACYFEDSLRLTSQQGGDHRTLVENGSLPIVENEVVVVSERVIEVSRVGFHGLESRL